MATPEGPVQLKPETLALYAEYTAAAEAEMDGLSQAPFLWVDRATPQLPEVRKS